MKKLFLSIVLLSICLCSFSTGMAKLLVRDGAFEAMRSPQMINKLLPMDEGVRKLLIKEMADNTEFAKIILKDAELSDAWKYLNKEGRTILKHQEEALVAFNKVRKNKKIIELGIDPADLARIQGFADASYAQVMSNMDNFVNALTDKNITVEGIEYIIKDLKGGTSFVDGANWTISYIEKNADNFANKSLKFEDIYRIGDDVGIRRVDLVDKIKYFISSNQYKTYLPDILLNSL